MAFSLRSCLKIATPASSDCFHHAGTSLNLAQWRALGVTTRRAGAHAESNYLQIQEEPAKQRDFVLPPLPSVTPAAFQMPKHEELSGDILSTSSSTEHALPSPDHHLSNELDSDSSVADEFEALVDDPTPAFHSHSLQGLHWPPLQNPTTSSQWQANPGPIPMLKKFVRCRWWY